MYMIRTFHALEKKSTSLKAEQRAKSFYSPLILGCVNAFIQS